MNSPDAMSNQPEDEPDDAATTTDSPESGALQNELAAEKHRYDRLEADFNSFRKRTVRDTEQRAAAQKDILIRELLVILDNLERALAAGGSATDPLRRGVEMTHQQMLGLLQRHGIEPDRGAGEHFDPHRHEAIGARNDPTRPDHVVLEVVQRGYRRGAEVIRPARVIINDLHLANRGGHGR